MNPFGRIRLTSSLDSVALQYVVPKTQDLYVSWILRGAPFRIGNDVIEMKVVLRSTHHASAVITLPDQQFHPAWDDPVIVEQVNLPIAFGVVGDIALCA